jgi:hypothetical protein
VPARRLHQKVPKFNTPGEKAGLYCAAHKLDSTVNVVAMVCQHDDCTKQPYFNTPGKKARIFCAAHKMDGMANDSSKKRAATGASGAGSKKHKLGS